MKTKFTTIVALVLSALLIFTSCATDATNGNSSQITSVDASQTTSNDSSQITSVDVSQITSNDSSQEAEGYRLNGVSLEEYCIIYADDAYGYSRDVARQFKSELEKITGVSLKLVEDTNEETEYEIIIGDTARTANLKMDTLETLEYAYVTEGKKVILNAGAPYMLELAAQRILQLYSMEQNLKISYEPRKTQFEFEKPKSVILIIGDGMGENHIRYTVDKKLGVWIGDVMPNKGECTTSSFTGVTDSAAAATALSTGYKTSNGSVGVDRLGNELKVMGELVKEMGKSLMITSNYDITDATPAGFTAHASDRELTTTLEEQQAKLGALVLGSFHDNTLSAFINALDTYEAQEEKNGFFFMNEDGYCDAAGHNNEFAYALGAVVRIDAITRYAISYVLQHPDTVLIVTADHETGGIKKNEETGAWEFTSTSHTGAKVPVYAMGYGTETFNDNTVDNTDISKFIAHIMGDSDWGDPSITPKIDFPELN